MTPSVDTFLRVLDNPCQTTFVLLTSHPTISASRVYHRHVMTTHDPASEHLRVAEHYRQLSDSELLILGRRPDELTDMAQLALANELSHRGLKPEADVVEPSSAATSGPPPAFFELESPKLGDSASYDFPNSNPTYDEDRKLVELCTVWSLRDALQVQTILDRAGIPFFMGPEKATGVDEVVSNFAQGVSVQIMRIGVPWAGPAMRHYEPKDDPNPRQETLDEVAVRCPRCDSAEVVFEGLVKDPTLASASDVPPAAADVSDGRFCWRCDSCGHRWEDEGVADEE